jgi:mRNA-degrading endonuclease YafQ of YafQ-DinJ toxin-antitoxin module
MADVKFFRSDLYKETYLSKILPNPSLKSKFQDFMEIKRQNPRQPFGGSDTAFASKAPLGLAIPNLRHAHITQDLSVIYRVAGNNIYLYGFFTHADLGTDGNIRRQATAATRLSNQSFV